MALVKVKFTETYTVNAAGGSTYEKGSVLSLAESSARHFINRRVAEYVSDAVVEKVPAAQADSTVRKIEANVDLHGLMNQYREQEGISDKPASAVQEKTSPLDNPMVSCIMPTWNRKEFIAAAIDCWQKQTYQNKELIILDDGDQSIKSLVPKAANIRYIRRKQKANIGDKRNKCCELAQGEIICHWDDDDWSDPDRIDDQVRRLKSTGRSVTGYSTMNFYDRVQKKAKRYSSTVAGYVCGTSLCYLKSFWLEHKFESVNAQEDNRFVYANLKSIASSRDPHFMVARIHDCHHSSSKTGIAQVVDSKEINLLFWENEKLIEVRA